MKIQHPAQAALRTPLPTIHSDRSRRWPALWLAALLAVALLLGAAAGARAQEGTIHVVVPGDTLSEIAVAYGTDVATLRELNGIQGNLIRIGQRLIVGPPGTRVAPAARAATAGSQLYTVRRGDNLSLIARRYGVSVEEIALANGIDNPRLLVEGTTIVIPAAGASGVAAPVHAGKWIDVDLSAQRVVAYEGARAVRTFRVSTGLPETPTVTGTFRIRLKIPSQDMSGGNRFSGDAYHLEDVPWVQYFFSEYAFHGTYWHTRFGRPASRGCINMAIEDAKWLFDWTEPEYASNGPYWQGATASNPGTLVVVHE